MDKSIRNDAPTHIRSILTTRKYLGVLANAQLDNEEGKKKKRYARTYVRTYLRRCTHVHTYVPTYVGVVGYT